MKNRINDKQLRYSRKTEKIAIKSLSFNYDPWFYVLAIIIPLLVFGCYLKCLTPLEGAGDAAEFSTAGYLLGVPHFPGYPLWVLCAKLFASLPLGYLAYRLNFLSAFWGAAALFFVFLLASELINVSTPYAGETRLLNLFFSGVTTLLIAFIPANLMVNVEADVYSLNLFFVTLLTWLAWRHRDKYSSSIFYLTALLVGLGVSNHYHSLLLLPALLFLLYRADKAFFRLPRLLRGFFWGLLGWGCYPLIIPLRAIKEPGINWNRAFVWERFYNQITLKVWSETQTVGTLHNLSWLLTQLKYLALIFFQQFGWLLFLLLVAWAWQVTLGEKKWRAFSGIFLFFTIAVPLFVLNYQDLEHALNFGDKFYLPAYFILILMLGMTLANFARKNYIISKKVKIATLVTILTLIVSGQIFSTLFQENHRGNFLPHDLGQNILSTLPAQAVLFSQGFHQTNALLFQKYALGKRPDVTVIDRYGNLFAQAYLKSTLPLAEKAKVERQLIDSFSSQGRAVFYNVLDFQNLLDLPFVPQGLLYQYQRSDFDPWPLYRQRGIKNTRTGSYLGSAIASEYYFHQGEIFNGQGKPDLAANYYRQALNAAPRLEWVAQEAARSLVAANRQDLAIPLYRQIVKLNPQPANFYLLGTALTLAAQYQEAVEVLQQAIAAAPENAQYRFSQGLAYQQAGQFNQAAATFHGILNLDPAFLPARFCLAQTYEQLNPAQAISYWRDYLSRAPATPAEAGRINQARERLAVLGAR